MRLAPTGDGGATEGVGPHPIRGPEEERGLEEGVGCGGWLCVEGPGTWWVPSQAELGRQDNLPVGCPPEQGPAHPVVLLYGQRQPPAAWEQLKHTAVSDCWRTEHTHTHTHTHTHALSIPVRRGLTPPRRCLAEGDVPAAVREREREKGVGGTAGGASTSAAAVSRSASDGPPSGQAEASRGGCVARLPSQHPGPARTSASPPAWTLWPTVPPS